MGSGDSDQSFAKGALSGFSGGYVHCPKIFHYFLEGYNRSSVPALVIYPGVAGVEDKKYVFNTGSLSYTGYLGVDEGAVVEDKKYEPV